MMTGFSERGWAKFAYDDALMDWVKAALPAALAVAQDDEQQKQWLRCGGTWFVGVNALPNGSDGAVGAVPLRGAAVEFAQTVSGCEVEWDAAQVSVCYEGYPKPWGGESEGAFRYRRDKDAAHVDGLHRDGPHNRRFVREFHQFVLGIPLNDVPSNAAPFVVWEGSHLVMKDVFQKALSGIDPAALHLVDLTDVYQAARKTVFETCERVKVTAKPGEAYVIHRHALHGVAPWGEGVHGPPEGRMIAYFRPAGDPNASAWLERP